ncbi:MAG: hypothetical protein JSR53_15185 [Proteobacteria bacterium]|nr:hypothetical protein [Pseudomonadota bacterium]
MFIHAIDACYSPVIPAKAAILGSTVGQVHWIPAFAGMAGTFVAWMTAILCRPAKVMWIRVNPSILDSRLTACLRMIAALIVPTTEARRPVCVVTPF